MEIASKTLFPSAQLTQDSEAGFQRMTRAFSDALMVEDAAGLEQAQKEGESIAARLASAAQLPGMTLAQSTELRRLSDTIRTLAGDARAAYASMIGSGGNLTEQMQSRSRDIAARTATAKDALSKLRQSMSAELRDGLAETAASSARQRTLSLVVFALALLIAGAAVHLTVQRSILGPVGRIATGIGEATRMAMDAAERMAVAGDRVNKGAVEQAACVEETTASLTEILATTQQNVARAAEADKLMSDATSTVSQSTSAVDNLTRSMHEIAQASQQVSGVLKSINEIAFQTNLLALNAAVEAARAGAAGAGFAVVAEEVRALAARTAEAARNSAALIEQAGEKVTQGVQYVDATRRAFGDLAQVVTASGQVVSEIATSTEEQAKSINYINTAMSRIEQVAQTNTANAHETAESAALVNEQVRATQHHISWFAESWPGA